MATSHQGCRAEEEEAEIEQTLDSRASSNKWFLCSADSLRSEPSFGRGELGLRQACQGQVPSFEGLRENGLGERKPSTTRKILSQTFLTAFDFFQSLRCFQILRGSPTTCNTETCGCFRLSGFTDTESSARKNFLNYLFLLAMKDEKHGAREVILYICGLTNSPIFRYS